MKNTFIVCFLSACALLLFSQQTTAQALDYQNVITIVLEDGTTVVLYGRAGEERMQKTVSVENNLRASFTSNASGQDRTSGLSIRSALPDLTYGDDYYFTADYYYLPTNLRLSNRPDGVPEFLFLKYTTEEKADAGGVQGALMHFLIEWGLTPDQEKELTTKLKAKVMELKKNPSLQEKFARVTNPVVVGPVRLQPGDESFRIISATLSDKTLAPTVVTSGKAPTMPGQKSAVASNLSKNGAQLLAATFEKNRSITDVSIELRFKYNVLMPAFKGTVTIDYTKLQTMYNEKYKKTTNKDQDSKDEDDDYVKVTDREVLVDNLLSSKVVDVALTDMGTNTQISKTIIDAIMNMIVASLEADGDDFQRNDKDKEEDQPKDEGIREGTAIFDKIKLKAKMARGKEVINLSYRMAITEEVGVTGNLGSWYDHVRNNPKCVSAVNLNDPFFQHRDINLILDLEAESMFGKEVNYVTVNVRKRRQSGNPFQEQVTIDRKYLADKGIRANMTYARGEDKNPDVYEFKSQWSLKGGKMYPESPQWIKGDWQGVTLAAPVKPRVIQFEGDLDEMKQYGITRATLQLRYYKFGQEVESNIPLTVSKGIPLMEDMIFTDREQQGYAYRLVLTHKEKGKMALDWETKINDDYIYATIPQKFKDNDKEFLDKIIEAGKVVLTPTADGALPKEAQILDKFKDLLQVFDK